MDRPQNATDETTAKGGADRKGERQPHRLNIPGFIKEEVGLGDVIKRATYAVGFKPCDVICLFGKLIHSRSIAGRNTCGNRSWFGHVHPFDVLAPVSVATLRSPGALERLGSTQSAEIRGDVTEGSAPSNISS